MQQKVKPFVKWAGGKSGLLSQIDTYLPIELKTGKIDCYIEPFVGGGAVLIDILQRFDVKKVYAFDINQELINAYQVIKKDVDELIAILTILQKEYLKLDSEGRKEYYYNQRKKYNSYRLSENEISVFKAAEFIFLNKTCFNGLYRVNKEGNFNVPMGAYKNPTICDECNLRALSKLIQNVEFECVDYTEALKYSNENTFVYFDPPYRPLNLTSGFTSYTKDDFDDEDQKKLANFYKELSKSEAKLMLSNSNPKNIDVNDTFFDDIYNGFNINEVYANRCINSKANKRGAISELLITNYLDNGEIRCIMGDTILSQNQAISG